MYYPLGVDDSAKTRSKTHTGKLMLQKIYSTNNNKPMLYADLEERLSEYISSERLNTFKVETGWTLHDFLIKNKDCYEIYVKKKRKFVKLKAKLEFMSSSEDKTKKAPETQSSNSLPCNINDAPAQQCTIDSCTDFTHALSDEETWTKVTSRKKKRSQCISSTLTEQGKPTNETMPLCEKALKPTYAAAVNGSLGQIRQRAWKPERFEAVLQNGENRDTVFVRSPDIYVKNQLRFSVDVVSMWNTPHRKNSYIILGVSKAELLGIDKSFDVNIFKSLFQKHYFSQKPVFNSFVVDYALKRFCIIEIESSYGHGGPCVVETDVTGTDGISILERQVWVRSGARNVVCNVKNVTEVYQWFIGQLPKSKPAQNGEDKKEKEQSVRHAGTNTKLPSELTDFSSSDEEPLYSSGDTFSFFWDAVKGFGKGHFVLLTGNVTCQKKYLDALAKVPWISVYDFDIFSCSDGLLNALQDSLATERHLTISTWNETAENISERGTRWCFMRGRREMCDSRTDLKMAMKKTSTFGLS